ncbi:sensor histidine kinase [Poseidonibacter lekithochrous]|uniref:sensor histidine kinase n=1 Tax=Poseidonibacter lekithochrous TaxID=1904463 RepID=UPI0008FCADFE|nr:HAMP domain-containing sensor histidine kinase [Poseidonibacter lekithochrous]QKJ24388.1 signal transduction sensor histidine kinase [Poseidonibacter lekithochrous]
MRKNLYRIPTIITFAIITILAFSMTTNYIYKKENQLLDKKYTNHSSNIQDKINSLILKKKNATLALTITLADNKNILDIATNNLRNDELNKLSLLLRKETDFKNVWFQVINKDGVSIHRSWSEKRDDVISKVRPDLQEMLKNPKIKSTVSVGKYDITFKAMVPIYNNNEFVGIIESITHFNSISRGLRLSDNLEPIVIIDEKYTKQLKENAFTKIFLQNHYVANLSVNKELLDYLRTQDLESFLSIEKYKIDKDKLVVNTPITYGDKVFGSFLVFKYLDRIDTSYIKEYKQNAFLYLGLFVILLGLILYIISYYLYSKELKKLYKRLRNNQKELNKLNSSLQQTVDDEVNKNYEKNKMLFQQSKMAAMGEMIGNIAHQWRQPLSVITTAATGMKLKKEIGILNDQEYDESMDMIVNSANYLSSTIEDFRNFFSPNKNKNIFNSEELIEKVFTLIQSEFNTKNIVVVTNIYDFEVFTYENELLQVLINLLNNARDELINVEDYDSRFIFMDFYEKDENAIIKIKDSAGGIPSDIIDRIFEPYFTTKHQSQGTGIGLFMSEEIISKHMNGEISVDNETYEYKDKTYTGAAFTLSIPMNDKTI